MQARLARAFAVVVGDVFLTKSFLIARIPRAENLQPAMFVADIAIKLA